MNVFLLILSFSRRPIGSHPDTWNLYRSHINKTNGTFTCFDNSNIINISQINDNHLDCTDGSDEPGTTAFPNGTFYCRNEGWTPMEIPKAKVNNEICDCCDGSDEYFNTENIDCPNTCYQVELTRDVLLEILTHKYEKGIDRRQTLQEAGEKYYTERKSIKKSMKRFVRYYDKFLNYTIGWTPPNSTSINETTENNTKINEKATEDEITPNKYLNFSLNMPISAFEENIINSTKKPPIFIKLLYQLWKFTFRPRNSNLVFSKALKQACIQDLVNFRGFFKEGYNINKQAIRFAKNSDNESFALLGELLTKDDYELEFLSEFRFANQTIIGKFKERTDDYMIYDNGIACVDGTQTSFANFSLICYSNDKLVKVSQINECKYNGILLTPVACTSEKLERLKELPFEELKKMYRLYGIRKLNRDDSL